MNTSIDLATLQSERLRLDPLGDDDLEAILQLYADAAVGRGFGQDCLQDRAQARYWLDVQQQARAAGTAAIWCLRPRDGARVLGCAGFDVINRSWRNAAISCALHPDVWGQGLMPEALRCLIAYAFAGGLGTPLHRIEALVLPDNARSLRVLAKLGFAFEGQRRGLLYWQGRYHDPHAYALINPAD